MSTRVRAATTHGRGRTGGTRRRHAGVVGIDLGTSTTLAHGSGRVLASEASVVAVRPGTDTVVAVGDDAQRLLRRPSTRPVERRRPLRAGVVADVPAAAALLRHVMRATSRRPRVLKPRVVVAAPAEMSTTERRTVIDATLAAGAGGVAIIDEPMAAAIGADLPVAEPDASMILHIGAGITEAAVISLGAIVSGASVRVGGDSLDAAIAAHVERHHGVLIAERTAEDAKLDVGSAHGAADGRRTTIVSGRDQRNGAPARVELRADEVRHAIEDPLRRIDAAVRLALEEAPPELAADMVHRGLLMTGGGALLPGLDRRLHERIGMPVTVARRPLAAVAVGTGLCLEHIDVLEETA